MSSTILAQRKNQSIGKYTYSPNVQMVGEVRILTYQHKFITMGYRDMIRDRIPVVWDLALKYNRCKKAYVERVYRCYVKRYDNHWNKSEIKKKKSETIKNLMNPKKSEFIDTVDVDIIKNKEEYEYWTGIHSWVRWFARNSMFVFQEIKDLETKGKNDEEIEKELAEKFSLDTKLSEFLVKNKQIYFKNGNI